MHNQFGSIPLRPWTPEDPGFHLGWKELLYYSVRKRIKVFTSMYYTDYIRSEAEGVIKKEYDWVYPGAHYYDDLYHSLIKYVHRVKFNIDLNMNSDAALVRSGQMKREDALNRVHGIYSIEDPKVIDLCIKRLGLKQEEFDEIMKIPPKTFRDYNTSYPIYRAFRWPINILSQLNLLPRVTHIKYFECGE